MYQLVEISLAILRPRVLDQFAIARNLSQSSGALWVDWKLSLEKVNLSATIENISSTSAAE